MSDVCFKASESKNERACGGGGGEGGVERKKREKKEERKREKERKLAFAAGHRKTLFQFSWELNGPKTKTKSYLCFMVLLFDALKLSDNSEQNQKEEKMQNYTVHDEYPSNCWSFLQRHFCAAQMR